jgi:hypothetical protein
MGIQREFWRRSCNKDGFHEKTMFQVNFMFNNNTSINNKRIFKGNYVITTIVLMSHLVLISVSNTICTKT